MKNFTFLKRRLLKKILIVLGVCSAGLMASCAKYGTLVSGLFMEIKGTVRSKNTNLAIEGVMVELTNGISDPKILTNSLGEFTIDSDIDKYSNTVNLHISDIDGSLNGSFVSKDTAIILTADELQAQLKENIEIKLVKNE